MPNPLSGPILTGKETFVGRLNGVNDNWFLLDIIYFFILFWFSDRSLILISIIYLRIICTTITLDQRITARHSVLWLWHAICRYTVNLKFSTIRWIRENKMYIYIYMWKTNCIIHPFTKNTPFCILPKADCKTWSVSHMLFNNSKH